MTTSIYSYMGSRVHLGMDDRLAEDYNQAMHAWFQAQKDFEKVHGRKCTTDELIKGEVLIRVTNQQAEAYNAVAKFMNKMYDDGLVLTEEECSSEYLIKVDSKEEAA